MDKKVRLWDVATGATLQAPKVSRQKSDSIEELSMWEENRL
jgi:hypothetical protein